MPQAVGPIEFGCRGGVGHPQSQAWATSGAPNHPQPLHASPDGPVGAGGALGLAPRGPHHPTMGSVGCPGRHHIDGSICFFTISHKKVIPDWDDLWGTIAHMGSSQTGMNMCCYDLKNNTQNLTNSKCAHDSYALQQRAAQCFAWVAC